MEDKHKLRISQCMIVKNEEANIRRALSWGRDFMWEQVVVDTGSTDRTAELAQAMGAKVVSFPWADDFSAAKNYGIGQASGDWILFLDADEYLIREDVPKLVRLLGQLEDKEVDGVTSAWIQVGEDGTIAGSGIQVRAFRNRPDLRYRRRIHEQLCSSKGRPLRLADAVDTVSVFHTGYQQKEAERKGSTDRNRRLIRLELADHPHDPEMLGYLGDCYYAEGRRDEAEGCYKAAADNLGEVLADCDQRSAATFTNLLRIMTEGGADGADGGGKGGKSVGTGKAARAWEEIGPVYSRAVGLLPKEPDFDFVAGLYFFRMGWGGEAADHMEAAVGKLERYGANGRGCLTAANMATAYQLLAKCCYEEGRLADCVRYGVTWLRWNPEDMAVLGWVLKAVCPTGAKEEALDQAMALLGKLYDFSQLRPRLLVYQGARGAGCPAMAEFLKRRLFSKEEQAALESGPDGKENR